MLHAIIWLSATHTDAEALFEGTVAERIYTSVSSVFTPQAIVHSQIKLGQFLAVDDPSVWSCPWVNRYPDAWRIQFFSSQWTHWDWFHLQTMLASCSSKVGNAAGRYPFTPRSTDPRTFLGVVVWLTLAAVHGADNSEVPPHVIPTAWSAWFALVSEITQHFPDLPSVSPICQSHHRVALSGHTCYTRLSHNDLDLYASVTSFLEPDVEFQFMGIGEDPADVESSIICDLCNSLYWGVQQHDPACVHVTWLGSEVAGPAIHTIHLHRTCIVSDLTTLLQKKLKLRATRGSINVFVTANDNLGGARRILHATEKVFYAFGDTSVFAEEVPLHSDIPASSPSGELTPGRTLFSSPSMGIVNGAADVNELVGRRTEDKPDLLANEETKAAMGLCALGTIFRFHTGDDSVQEPADLSNSAVVLEGPIRGGGYCDIFLGECQSGTHRSLVAMKQLRVYSGISAQAIRLFRREVKIWSKFEHPYILPFLGYSIIGDTQFFMVSPWIRNGHCMEYLETHPHADRSKLLSQVADALDYLHSGRSGTSYIHGDVKWDNVLISDEGNALLADFGLTRHMEKMCAFMSATPSIIPAMGLVRFASPELLSCDRPTRESDVYAFGCLIVQVFTGKLPYSGMTDVEVITAKVLHGTKPLAERPTDQQAIKAGLDQTWWDLIGRCVEHQPSSRPTMDEISSTLSVYREPVIPT
ncbi:hypothetical protein JAAARDRAFT_610188 [Jaapia argillacea MUCL 33604]|uniref:Protein kinase domain-containing protein n=1 Tax=Jaapia argillacea MUCL 33604 TaxID=933084 RepID=A0A067P5J9_9AGAM|nr:hypothetical protein JAAARDRAFT_610188 [Jaapia argillacea MUCL 33604]